MIAVTARTAYSFSRVEPLGNIGAFRASFLTVLLRLRGLGSPLACLVLHSALALGMQRFDRLLHERPALLDAAVDLLRQNSEPLVTQADRLLLPLLRYRWGHCQLVSRV